MVKDIVSLKYQPTSQPKLQRFGKELLERIYKRDFNAGGSFTSILGAPGAGKTSAMLSLVNNILKNNKNELVFWSSSYGAPLQFFRLPYHILCKKGMNIKFRDRISGKDISLPHDTFNKFEELYSKAQHGKLNCVFFGDRAEWMNFTEFLMEKGGWHTIAIDELSEVVPSDTGSQMYKRIAYFANHVCGQTRKCGITIISNTQSPVDVDYRVRKKLNLYIMFAGARVPKKATRVYQQSVDNLNEDHKFGSQCYIASGARFGVITFKDIFTPIKDWSVEAKTSFRALDNYGIDKDERREKRTEEIASKADERRHRSSTIGTNELLERENKWRDTIPG